MVFELHEKEEIRLNEVVPWLFLESNTTKDGKRENFAHFP